MAKGVKYMVREYVSGEVTERVRFPVGNAAKPRKKRTGATTPRKQEQNERAAERRLARLINCNFTKGCLLLTLSYSLERFERLVSGIILSGLGFGPEAIRSAAIQERNNFLRRVKDMLKQSGVELKYIAVTSDVNSDTGEHARVHHHILVPKEALDAIVKHWSADEVDIRPLRDQKDYTPIAAYLLKQVKRQKDKSKWSASRNLAHPIVEEWEEYGRAELKAPPKAQVMARSEYDQDQAFQYIRYIKPPKAQRRRGKAEFGARRVE